jgi:hypothetical protein
MTNEQWERLLRVIAGEVFDPPLVVSEACPERSLR